MKYIVDIIYNTIIKYNENKFKREISKVSEYIYTQL